MYVSECVCVCMCVLCVCVCVCMCVRARVCVHMHIYRVETTLNKINEDICIIYTLSFKVPK